MGNFVPSPQDPNDELSKCMVECEADSESSLLLNLSKKIDVIFDRKLQDCRFENLEEKVILLEEYLQTVKKVNSNLIEFVEQQQIEHRNFKDSNLKETSQLAITVRNLREIIKGYQIKELERIANKGSTVSKEVENPINDLQQQNDFQVQVDFEAVNFNAEIQERKRVKQELEKEIEKLKIESEILCETNREFESEFGYGSAKSLEKSDYECSCSSMESLLDKISTGFKHEIQILELKLKEQCQNHQKELNNKERQITQLTTELEQLKRVNSSQQMENRRLKEEVKFIQESFEKYDTYIRDFREQKSKSKSKSPSKSVKKIKIVDETFDGDRTFRSVTEKSFKKTPEKRTRTQEITLDPQELLKHQSHVT